MNAPETFCALPAPTDPQKALDLHRGYPPPAPHAPEEQAQHWTKCPKSIPLADWARSLRVAHFGALRPSSPRSEQGVIALRSPPYKWMGEEHPYPFHSQMAKVERGETVWKIGMCPESGLRKRPTGVERVPIGRFLPQKKPGSKAVSRFSKLFRKGNSQKFA